MNNSKLCSPQSCTLCMACVNICHQAAIALTTDENGYEKIHIDSEKCIDCGLCTKVCNRREAVVRNNPLTCFAAQATDKERLMGSASGGAFQTIARYVLCNGGVCYGSEGKIYQGQYTATHVRIDTPDDLYRILNSKYIPSIIGDSYKQAKADLQKGLFVLFCGTPCQIQGLKAYLGTDYDNLLTTDLICHGVASTQIFGDYIGELEKRDNITVVDYQFRDKSVSWGTNFCYSYYKNSNTSKKVKVRHCPREASSYMINYLKGNIFRENCYDCALSCSERVSDFTLGDYWEIETEHPEFVTQSKPSIVLRQGVSCILVNTQKAADFIGNISSEMILREVTFESVASHNGNLRRSSKRGRSRDAFLESYRQYGYSSVEDQYRKKVSGKMVVYNLKNMLKSRLPDRVRIFIYNTPFLRKIVFH